MGRNTHVVSQHQLDHLDGQIAQLRATRDAIATKTGIDIDILIDELKHSRFRYWFGSITIEPSRILKKMLPQDLGRHDDYDIKLTQDITLNLSDSGFNLRHSSENPNNMLPFLRANGVPKDAISLENPTYWVAHAKKEWADKERDLQAKVAAIEETYAS